MTDPVESQSRRAFFRRMAGRWRDEDFEAAPEGGGPAADSPAPEPTPAPPARPEPIRLNEHPEMTYAPLGRTNFMVSRLSLGCATIRERNLETVREAVERGVNLLDTALSYGTSETALSRLLPEIRDRVWISSKTPPFDASLARVEPDRRDEAAARLFADSIDSSLARLAVDRIDIYMVQSAEGGESIRGPALAEAIEKARRSGKIRHAGLSTVRRVQETLDAAIESDLYDVLACPIHPLNLSQMPAVADRARFKGIGLLGIMTTLALDAIDAAAELADYEFAELPDGLDPHGLTYLYLLKNAPYANFVVGASDPVRCMRNFPLAAYSPGHFASNELDALVYDRLWPYCTVCGSQRSFGNEDLEAAYQARAAQYDTSGCVPGAGLGGFRARPGDFLKVCAQCAASR